MYSSSMGFVAFLAVISTIALTVLAYIFIIPEKKRARLNKLGQFLHDVFNFKFLIIEKIMQFFYVLATISVICLGVAMLFGFGYSRYMGLQGYGFYGILFIILGPIAVRIAYEAAMLFLLLVKNVIQINRKMADQTAEKDYEFPGFKALFAKENFDFFKKNNNQGGPNV